MSRCGNLRRASRQNHTDQTIKKERSALILSTKKGRSKVISTNFVILKRQILHQNLTWRVVVRGCEG